MLQTHGCAGMGRCHSLGRRPSCKAVYLKGLPVLHATEKRAKDWRNYLAMRAISKPGSSFGRQLKKVPVQHLVSSIVALSSMHVSHSEIKKLHQVEPGLRLKTRCLRAVQRRLHGERNERRTNDQSWKAPIKGGSSPETGKAHNAAGRSPPPGTRTYTRELMGVCAGSRRQRG
ncbi:unnamed protein product [Pleuronectes platessa]|uniref:Uncharacterized protein n=1 Tax=Pleuronectes platessa TaxID=8262 RepID=A0A9N7UTC0_PLEPL|nr:unnamed protein product [Pleuronectes platessa]